MYKKEVLLTSGCSFTDNWWTKKHNIPVWPELFAKQIDMQCINLGKRGLGNDYILNSIVDKVATEKNIGLVVVMWSEFGRIDFELEEDVDIYDFYIENSHTFFAGDVLLHNIGGNGNGWGCTCRQLMYKC